MNGFLIVPEIVGRHNQDTRHTCIGCFLAQQDRAVQHGMANVHQNRQAASLNSKLQHPAAVFQHEVEELSG